MKIPPATRRDARLTDSKFYFTGEPCKHGHIEKRQTSNGCCYGCSKLKSSTYAKNNRQKINDRKRADYHANIEENREYHRDHYARNPDIVKKNNKRYVDKNKDKVNEYKLRWHKERYKNDPTFRLTHHMRRTLKRVLNYTGNLKNRRTTEYLGYTTEELRNHIESQFVDGMSWGNYGDWHIDHVIPVIKWIQAGVTDPSVINALDNLQPLWAKENMSKGGRIIC